MIERVKQLGAELHVESLPEREGFENSQVEVVYARPVKAFRAKPPSVPKGGAAKFWGVR
jgi:hypothetical protein